MAAVSARRIFDGHPELGATVDNDTWLTPRYILDQLGSFDLDPCAADCAPKWTNARFIFTKHSDGLADNAVWNGRVFMNPPFSATSRWLARHAKHANGISLVPATTESIVWRKHVWTGAKAILLLHGRMRFCNLDGSATTGRPLRSIALIAWTEFDAAVLRGSTLAGVLLEDWKQH